MKHDNILLKSALALAIVDLVLIAAILLQVNGLVKDVLEVQNRQMEIGVMRERLEKAEEVKRGEVENIESLEKEKMLEQAIEAEVEIAKKIDMNVSKWLTYRNEEYGFEIKYPKEFTIDAGRRFVSYKEGKGFGAFFSLSFTLGDIYGYTSRFFILPEGGLGYGLPFEEPKVQNLIIAGREATRRDWVLENGGVLTIIDFKNYPQKWNQQNRIDIHGSKKEVAEVFYKILETFKFVD